MEESRGAAGGPDEDGVYGIFHTQEMINDAETKAQGRVVIDSVPFVKMIFPNDPLTRVVERINDDHKKRWPKVWAAYEEKREGIVDGTPVEHLTILTRQQVATLKYLGIVTVEQLAKTGDNKINLDVTRDMRDRANQFLQGSSETEAELRRTIARLETENTGLKAQVEHLQRVAAAPVDDDGLDEPLAVAAMPKRRGRPPKNAATA